VLRRTALDPRDIRRSCFDTAILVNGHAEWPLLAATLDG
jgi:hypothetical protein